MSDKRKKSIADAADMIVDGYAVLKHELGYKIVNLNSGNVVIVSPEFKMLESNMDDIKETIAIGYLKDNLEFLAA